MALTQVKTTGLADDAVTGAKIADDTVAEANMANDAISLAELKAGTDGQVITYDASGNPTAVGPGNDGQVLTSTGAGSPPAFEDLPTSGATINNATENELVTVASTTTQLDAESTLTYDGNSISQAIDSNGEGINIKATGNYYPQLSFNSNRSSNNNTLGYIPALWNNTEVASISFNAGDDTSNKDNASIRFNTASAGSPAEAMRISPDGKLGIGETGPEEQLHITHATAPGLQFEATSGGPYKSLIKMGGNDMEIRGSSGSMEFYTGNADGDSSTKRMVIDSNGVLWHGVTPFGNHFTNRSAYFHKSGSSDWNYISITGGTSGGAGIVFGDSVENNTGNYESLIAHDNANNSLYLKTAQTAKGLEIKADGDVNVIDGNLSFAAGHGIDFSPNSHAGGMTSELLDDYEEGTFNLSPNLNNVSYTTQQFTYTKIGNVVHFSGRLSYSGASGVSDQLLGLPFLPNGIYVTSSFYVDSGLNIGSEDFFTVYTSPTASRMHMTTQSTATAYQMPGAADFYIAGFYKTNS